MDGQVHRQQMPGLREAFDEPPETILCEDCGDTGWLENRVEGRYPCTCLTETEPWQELQEQVERLRGDRERLDWLEAQDGCQITRLGMERKNWHVDADGGSDYKPTLREAIDAARALTETEGADDE